MRVHNAWQVHKQECQLERPPTRVHRGRVLSLHDAQALAGRTGHSPIGDAKGLEDLRLGQQCDTLLDPIGRHTSALQQFFSNLVATCRRSWHCVPLPINPIIILCHKCPELGLGISGIGKLAETVH